VRVVIAPGPAQRRRVAVGEEPQLELRAEHGRDGTLLGEPCERVWREGEDVELHGRKAIQGSGRWERYLPGAAVPGRATRSLTVPGTAPEPSRVCADSPHP